MVRIFAFLIGLLIAGTAHAQANKFGNDVLMCSGRPWLDVMCNGADPTGAGDSTAAINTTFNAAITNNWPVFFSPGTYKVTSKITVDYQGQAGNELEVISRGAVIDGRSIASGNVLQIQCSGGTVPAPTVCKNFWLSGKLTVLGTTNAYAVVLGKTDFSDRHDGVHIENLTVVNSSSAGGAGAIQLNYVTGANLWLSGSTAGGSSSIAAVALEQVQISRLGGYASALGTSASGLLIENGASSGNTISGFEYDPNNNTCVSVTSAAAVRNMWLVPVFPCTTAVNMSGSQNVLLGPSFAGTNMGPVSPGTAIVGRGALNRYSAPSVSSRTLVGADDGTIFSSTNATGASTQWTAASLPVTLPDPSLVGVGWTSAFVTDNGKAVVLTAPSGKILVANQQLSSLVVGGSGPVSNSEAVVLQSDGTNFRSIHMSQATALLNGAQTAWPTRWYSPGGPGYQLTTGDNAGVVSSKATSSGLAVTLPSTSGLYAGWAVGLSADGGKSLTVGGGTILGHGGAQVNSLPLQPGEVAWLQFDGSSFRIIGDVRSRGCANILDWGADPTGATDNRALILSAAAANQCVYFPRGTYTISAQIAMSLTAGGTSISFRGDGPDISILNWPTGGGFAATRGTSNRVSVRDMTLSVGVPNGGTAISVTGPSSYVSFYGPVSDIINVTIRGSDRDGANTPDGGPAVNYWTTGVSLTDVNYVNIYGLKDVGPGCNGIHAGQTGFGDGLVASGIPAGAAVVFNITSSTFDCLTNGIVYGKNVQGMTVTQSNFTGVYNGIHAISSSCTPTCTTGDQLNVSDSQFDPGNSGILVEDTILNVNPHHNVFILSGTSIGINMDSMYISNIDGNSCFPSAAHTPTCIRVNNTPGNNPGRIANNVIAGMGTGILITNNAFKVDVQENTMYANSVADIVSTNPFNTIHCCTQDLASSPITGVGNDGGQIQLTLINGSGFVTGQLVIVNGVIGTLSSLVWPANMIDSTHMTLIGSTFTGSYSLGAPAVVSTLP